MPDPQLAHARRGAEWTFDARAYHDCLATIKRTGGARSPAAAGTAALVMCAQAAQRHAQAATQTRTCCAAAPPPAGEARAPSFDHGVGDPHAGDIAVERHHRVVLSEGNYVLLVGWRCSCACACAGWRCPGRPPALRQGARPHGCPLVAPVPLPLPLPQLATAH